MFLKPQNRVPWPHTWGFIKVLGETSPETVWLTCPYYTALNWGPKWWTPSSNPRAGGSPPNYMVQTCGSNTFLPKLKQWPWLFLDSFFSLQFIFPFFSHSHLVCLQFPPSRVTCVNSLHFCSFFNLPTYASLQINLFKYLCSYNKASIKFINFSLSFSLSEVTLSLQTIFCFLGVPNSPRIQLMLSQLIVGLHSTVDRNWSDLKVKINQ